MNPINIYEAKTNLSRLIAALESGEEKEIVLARSGRPVAKITLIDNPGDKRVLGIGKEMFPALADDDSVKEDIDYINGFFKGEETK